MTMWMPLISLLHHQRWGNLNVLITVKLWKSDSLRKFSWNKTPVRACVLCAILLALSSSPWSQLWPLCQVCEWMDSPGSPPPSLSRFPSPLPSAFFLTPDYLLTYDSPMSSFIYLLIHWENIWEPDRNCSHWFIRSLFYFFLKTFFILNTLLSLCLNPNPPASSLLHPPQEDRFLLWKKKREQICVLKGLLRVMSIFHKIIWFSKVPFKQKQSTVNSDIL